MVSFSSHKLKSVLKHTNFKHSRVLNVVKDYCSSLLRPEESPKTEGSSNVNEQQHQHHPPSNIDSSIVNELNFGFGFDDIGFSDRVLRLEIIPSAFNTNCGGEKYLNWFSSIHDDSEFKAKNFEVKTLHISSLMLAAKSPFFYKLFKNGMKESQPRKDVTLRINAYEEEALMDVLNGIYDKPLKATSATELLDVLMAADKFEVVSCMRHCIELLLKLPMSLESALFYLELSSSVFSSSVFVGEVTKPLIDAIKRYLAARYSVFDESQQEAAMSLPLCAIEALLGSDDLQVVSEDDVFDFILRWARAHYSNLEERREIVTKRLAQYICFPHMSSSKLKQVVDCSDFDYEQLSKSVLDALFFKSDLHNARKSMPIKKTLLPSNGVALAPSRSSFPGRVNKHSGIVYIEIRKEECAKLFPSSSHERIYFEAFYLGELCFSIFANCSKSQAGDHFCLYVEMARGSEPCELEYEFAAMKKPSKEFEIKPALRRTFTDSKRKNGLCILKWTDLMSDGSLYFIDGILHLRAKITVINKGLPGL